MAERRYSPQQVRVLRASLTAIFGMLALGVVLALVTYPSWQLAVATACTVAGVPLAWVAVGAQLSLFAPGAKAGQHLRSAGPAVLAVVLLVIGALMFSQAPTG